MDQPSPAPRRLAPCPCGSGRRFKDCHGRLDRNPLLADAIARRASGDREGARALVARALREDPDSAAAFNLSGLLLQDDREVAEAIAAFGRAVALAPGFAEAHFNRALALLLAGDYAAAWPELRWRERIPGYADYANTPFGIPRWAGEPVPGKRLLVHAEQGQGDTIQFARFARRLARDGAEVELFCHPPMVPLLARVDGVRRAFSDLDERPTHDFHAALITDVGAHYLPTGTSPRWDAPLFAFEPAQGIVRLLEGRRRPWIGFAWRGSPRHANDRERSLDAPRAAALASTLGTVLSLQVDGAELLAHAPGVVDAGEAVRGWVPTAHAIAALDLVVSVDTAVAHLAASMGKPTWILVPASPDWRWGLTGETTPWYPSARLFRQERAGDWDGVFARVRTALAR